MQILSRLLRRPTLATSPAPMRRLSSPSRPFISFMTSAPARWWPSALAPEVCPPNPSTRRVFEFAHGSRYMASSSGVEGDELGKPYRRLLIPSANELTKRSAKELIARYEDGRPESCLEGGVVGTGCKLSRDDKDTRAAVGPWYPILPSSSHRDGSIYKGINGWKDDYNIADRTETCLEAMMLSDPRDCYMHSDGRCLTHAPNHMFQIFSVKLSKIIVDRESVEVYGYIAVRDNLDPLLNYVINYSRDDPIIIEQGSLLNMTGPKRGIEANDTILIEYDMRIKIGEQEKDDLQLIDGVSIFDDMIAPCCRPITCPIHGDCGVIDITAATLYNSVEATVEVVISGAQGSFRMCLDCLSSGLHEEIRLFDGAISESRALKRSVVAVVMDTQLDLKFKLGVDSFILAEHRCSFNTNEHGHVTEEIKTAFAIILVKVTWSTLPDREWPPKFLA